MKRWTQSPRHHLLTSCPCPRRLRWAEPGPLNTWKGWKSLLQSGSQFKIPDLFTLMFRWPNPIIIIFSPKDNFQFCPPTKHLHPSSQSPDRESKGPPREYSEVPKGTAQEKRVLACGWLIPEKSLLFQGRRKRNPWFTSNEGKQGTFRSVFPATPSRGCCYFTQHPRDRGSGRVHSRGSTALVESGSVGPRGWSSGPQGLTVPCPSCLRCGLSHWWASYQTYLGLANAERY